MTVGSGKRFDLFASGLSTVDLVRAIDRFLMFYIRTAAHLQRHRLLDRGDGRRDHLRAVIVDDALGLCEELDAAMRRHVAPYTDEWRATLDDPQRLQRFVSFVNAPHTPRPVHHVRGRTGQRSMHRDSAFGL